MKEQQNLHLQKVLQNLHQNGRYARFFLAISRFRPDIDVNSVGFCSKILYLIVKTSHTSNFDAEKRVFCANTTSDTDIRIKELIFHYCLCSNDCTRSSLRGGGNNGFFVSNEYSA